MTKKYGQREGILSVFQLDFADLKRYNAAKKYGTPQCGRRKERDTMMHRNMELSGSSYYRFMKVSFAGLIRVAHRSEGVLDF